MKKNNGITLIALVITIIVMLILVAVTITIAVNGGLFNYAQEAGRKTNEAKDLEQEYANLGDYEEQGFSTDYEYLIDKYAVKEIQFTIVNGEEEIECTAQKGMTWEEWYKSDYAKLNSDLDYSLFELYEDTDIGKTNLVYDEADIYIDPINGDPEYLDTEIEDGTIYYLG